MLNKFIVLLLPLSVLCFQDSSIIPTLENDPSALIEGKVNAITGQPVLHAEDLVIAGAEPIHITRTYIDGERPEWRFCIDTARVIDTDKSYRWIVWEKDRSPILYKKLDTVKLDGEDYIRCGPSNLEKGFSNTARGKISSRTNLKNNKVFIDEKFKNLIVHCADGTIRNYKKIRGVEREFQILSERLPNGNWILYTYEEIELKKDQKIHNLKSIRTTNPAQTKIYAKADFIYEDPKRKNKHFWIIGSDGQKIEYRFEVENGKQKGALDTVISSSAPDQSFGYIKYKNVYVSEWKGKGEEKNRLGQLIFPLQRSLNFDYYKKEHEEIAGQKIHLDQDWREDGILTDDPRRNCVKTLSAPIGTDRNPQITHSFVYDFAIPIKMIYGNKTRVYDIEGNWTDYFSDRYLRLERCERYSREGKCFGGEKFEWRSDTGFLISKIHLDSYLNPVYFTRYLYDDRGNITLEKFCGNLTGKGKLPHILNANKIPIENDLEIHSIKYSYYQDELNLLSEEEHDSGLRIVYQYLPKTDLIASKFIYDRHQLHLRHFFQYNADHILIREIEDDGASTDPNNFTHVTTRTIREISPFQSGPFIGMPEIVVEKYWENGEEKLLRKTVLSYTTGGNIEKEEIYDANNEYQFTLKTRYERGLPVEKVNAIGQVESFSYDELGNQKSHRENRLITSLQYDFSNRCTAIRRIGDDQISLEHHFEYDKKHKLIGETDPRGHQTIHQYDPLGRETKMILPPIPTEKKELEYPTIQQQYDVSGNVISKIDGMGNETKTQYNAYGKPVLISHPDGSREEFIYSLNGNLETHINSRGVSTTYEYDFLNRIRKKTTFSSQNHLLTEETYVYKGKQLVSFTDAEGYRSTYEYDGAGRKISQEKEGERICFSYDHLGRIHRETNGERVEVKEYDLLNRIISKRIESTSGEILREIAYEYDDQGNEKTIIRSIAGIKAYEEKTYDSLSRLIETKDPLGHVETICYNDFYINDLGQSVLQQIHTDPLGLKTIKTFNTRSQVAKVELKKDSTLSVEENTYDKNGSLTFQTHTIFSPAYRQIHTQWTYDARNRCTSLTEAGTKTTKHNYLCTGELEGTIKPNGVRLTYGYNDLGFLTSLTSSDGTVSHLMDYNRLGHLITFDGVTRKVDSIGRVLEEIFPEGYSIESSFDPMGRKTETRIPEANCLVGFEYNPADLTTVHRKTLDGHLMYSHSYLSRDLSGNLLESKRIDGTSIHYTVDPLSRKTEIDTPHFKQQVLEFDPVGNIRKMRLQNEEIAYSYDDLYQLTSESGSISHNYLYDPFHNRLEKDDETYSINSLNQVVSHYEYDSNGNPTRQGDVRYSYDALDRLIQIETPTLLQTFTYDFLNRRLSKTTIQNQSQLTHYFLYDGQNEIGAFDQNLYITELRILGETPHAEIGAAIAIELNGNTYTPIHDLQGNVSVLLNNGHPVFYQYSAFGEQHPSGSLQNPWGYSSKRHDETGLIYFGRRYYSPEFGRWMTPDPSGFEDGLNLYAYVHNTPLTNLDEYGLITYVHGQGWQNCPWKSPFSYSTTYSQDAYHIKPSDSWNHHKVPTQQIPSLDLYFKRSPHYYVNGILNTPFDNRTGANALKETLGPTSNVIPFYSQSFGTFRDLYSVYRSIKKPNYSSFATQRLNRELRFSSLSMDGLQDPRKVFVTAFSRGAADTYHAAKNLTPAQTDRLIITACGPTMILPKTLGFSVTNLISTGDWCSLHLNSELKKNPHYFDAVADVYLLPQKDGFSGFNRDHFFLSKTYQTGIFDFASKKYENYGNKR